MVLVTGGSGLLGQELIRQLLANGIKLTAIYNKTQLPKQVNTYYTEIQADILDVVALQNAMEGITTIYHCAAIVSFNPAHRQQLYKINVEGTANIVNAALLAGVQKLVYVSSVAALGRAINNTSINEKNEWSTSPKNSLYAETKHLAEMEVWRGVAEGLPAIIVCPSIILGEANWNNSSTAIFKNVYNNFGWYSTGTNGWVDVQDVAKVMIALMHSNNTNEKYIVNGHNETYKNVLTTIAKSFGKKIPTKQVTPLLAAIIWRWEKLKSVLTNHAPLITKETAHTALITITYDNSKLLETLPNFMYTPLLQSIQRVCNYLKSV